MEKRTSAFSRIFAAIALVGAVLVVVVVIAGSMNEDSGSSTKGHRGSHSTQKQSHPKTKAATYTVQTGDTLTSIAHETGVPVATILDLNPEVDPQILIAGEKLKLR